MKKRKDYYQIRINKTEFEKILVNAIISACVINRDQTPSHKDDEYIYGLIIRAHVNGLTDLVMEHENKFFLTDKVLKKVDKHLTAYNQFMESVFAKEVEEEMKKHFTKETKNKIGK